MGREVDIARLAPPQPHPLPGHFRVENRISVEGCRDRVGFFGRFRQRAMAKAGRVDKVDAECVDMVAAGQTAPG